MGRLPADANVHQLTRAVRQLQAQVAGLTGPAPSSFNGILKSAPANGDVFNGVTSLLWLEPDATTGKAGGLTVKRTESTWGVSAGTPGYGDAQPFEVLSPSATLASDESTDGHASGGVSTGSNPVLCRVDAFGGFGTVQGVHIAPGLRDTHGGGTPIGLWVQLTGVDTFGVAVTGPDPTYVPTPGSTLFSTAKFDGTTKYVTVDANGDLNSYNTTGTGGTQKKTATLYHGSTTPGFFTTFADDGTTGVAALYAGDTPAIGYRGILSAQTAATRVLGLKAAASQSAVLLANLDSTGATLLSCVDSKGDWVNFANDGTTGVASLYSGDTPAVGFRGLLAAQTAATTVLGLKAATSQTADVLATYSSSGTKIATIIDSTGNLVGGGSGLTSFQGRTTPAAVLTSGDVSGVGGELTSNKGVAGGYVGIDSLNRLQLSAGVSAPSNTTTPVGWCAVIIAGVVSKFALFQ